MLVFLLPLSLLLLVFTFFFSFSGRILESGLLDFIIVFWQRRERKELQAFILGLYLGQVYGYKEEEYERERERERC